MRAVPKPKPEAQVERLFLLSLSGMHAKTVICNLLTVSTVCLMTLRHPKCPSTCL